MSRLPWTIEKQHRRKAFTLVEMVVVFAVVGLALAGIWLYAGTVNNREAMQIAINQAWQIANGARDMYAGRAALAKNGSLSDYVCSGVFPSSMLRGTVTYNCGAQVRRSPVTPWSGGVNLGFRDTTVGGNSFTVFDIDFLFTKAPMANIPDCVNFLGHFLTSGSGGNAVDTLRAEGGPVDSSFRNGGGSWSGSLRNLSQAQISASMPAGCTGVRLTFRL